MLSMIGEAFKSVFSIAEPVLTNTLDGNFAPTTWDSMIMSHGSEHAASQLATGAESLRFDEWLRNAHASGDLSYALEDSQALGISLEEHMINQYGHEGH